MDSINISPVARKATEYSLRDGASINKSILFLFFIFNSHYNVVER